MIELKTKLLKLMVLSLLPIIFALTLASLPVSALDNPILLDITDALTNEEEDNILSELTQFSENSNLNLCIVLSNDINGKEPADYADDIYDEQFGINTDGVLLLINDDTKIDWLSTSGIAIQYYTDEYIQEIHGAAKQHLVDGDYASALSKYIENLNHYYQLYLSDETAPAYSTEPKTTPVDVVDGENSNNVFLCIVISLFATGIFMLIVKQRYKTNSTISASEYLDSEGMDLYINTDEFKKEYIISRKIEKTPPSNNNNSSNSSTHTSSNGGTHGGGGNSR